LALCASIACAATWTALLAGSAVVWGLTFGLIVAALWSPPALFQPGISFAAKRIMRIGVALLGFQISLATLHILDVSDVVALAIDVALVLTAGWFLGPVLGIKRELSLVAAASVAICGASAAVAVACVVMRDDSPNRDVACTIGAVSIISSGAMVLYPFLAQMTGLGSAAGGIFLGGSIHEVAPRGRRRLQRQYRDRRYGDRGEAGSCGASYAGLHRRILRLGRQGDLAETVAAAGLLVGFVVAAFLNFRSCPTATIGGVCAAFALLSRHVDGGKSD
jgi:hypothetical protein